MNIKTKVGSKRITKTVTFKLPKLAKLIRAGYVKKSHLDTEWAEEWYQKRRVPIRIGINRDTGEVTLVLVKEATKLERFLSKGGKAV